MPRVLRALRWYDYVVVAAGLGLVVWLGGPDEPPVATFDTPASIVFHGDRKMRDAARTTFETEFAAGSYFGAFYYASEGSYGWTTGHNTPRAARANAEAHCAQHAGDCRLVAELLPEGFEDRGGITLRASAAEGYRGYVAGSGARAMAASENGAWGWSDGHATLWAAKSAAIQACEGRREEGQAGYLPDWPCKIIVARWR